MEQLLYELLRRCTVRVSVRGKVGHGTGFFVAPGLILTCAHVVKTAQPETSSVEVSWNAHFYPAQITQYLPDPDLALLEVDLAGHPCVLFREEVSPFDTLYSYGYPDDHPSGDPATFTLEGRAGEQGEQLKFKTGQVRPGLSGAPLLNTRTGCVCGIVQFTRDRASDLGGRAIPTSTIFQMLPDVVTLQQQFHRQDRNWTKYLEEQHAPTPMSQNRQRMLDRVQTIWIRGLLEQSLHDAALLALGLQEQPDAVANPWRLAMQEADQPPQSLPPGTRITQVYDSSDHTLLILGEPGAGKTTLLLELARELLSRAKQDEAHPIPVVFHLSSWGMKRQPLINWLVEELNTKYQVPRKLGKVWVETDQVLPLLDGLDEVAPEYRMICVEAINLYRREHGFVPLVVCSRSTEYLEQATRLLLHSAVIVQPLTQQQIDDYLTHGGELLSALRVVLYEDATLRELTSTPLMLSILTLTYQGMPIEDLLRGASLTDRQRQVFEHYVERMLRQRGAELRYTQEQSIHWLSWLAKQLKQHRQTVFYIERMQPDWLVEQWSRQRYPQVVVGLIYGLLGFFGLGPLGGIILTSFLIGSSNSALRFGFFLGLTLLSGFVGGAIFGLVNGVCYKQNREGEPISKAKRLWKQVRQRITRSALNGLLIGLLVGCPYGAVLGYQVNILDSILVLGVSMSGLGGLVFGLIDGLLDIQTTKIEPAETFAWSWANMGGNLAKFLFFGLLSSLLIGLFVGLLAWATNDSTSILDDLLRGLQLALTFVPFFALLGGLLGGLTGGLSSGVLQESDITIPNQGIRRSARHSVLVGIISALISMGIAVLIEILLGVKDPWPFAFILGPLIGLVSGLRAGGMACIQHVVLRWLLQRGEAIPRNYPRFLDYAAGHVLLRKVGGGYVFVHRLLLDYVASLDASEPSDL